MSLSRRSVLALLALGVTGCTSSPVITGGPQHRPVETVEPTLKPTRSPEAAAAHLSVAELRLRVESLIDSPHWELQPWAVAALAQCDAHLLRLSVADVLSDSEQEPFEVAPGAVSPPANPAVATNRLDTAVSEALEALTAAAAAAESPDLRLAYVSMATATSGLLNRSLAPVESAAAPRRLQPTTLEASLPLLLGHVWALAYGLGVGLGRLSRDDSLHDQGAGRLNEVRELRNALRAELGADAPEQPAAFELPTPMSTPEEIRAGWGELELQVLLAFARLVAADDDPRWPNGMLTQVAPVHAMGTALTWWPGWLP